MARKINKPALRRYLKELNEKGSATPVVVHAQVVGDGELDNNMRAGWAEGALQHFADETRTDQQDMLKDLLCDLMHWADATGESFYAALDTARNHYEAEVEEDGGKATECK